MDMMLEQFKTIFDRPEKVKKLRETILDLAVRGKLVPQDPNDESASVLLERIKEEKERLIKEKKIKKEKPLAKISDDEKPVELPTGWEFVRIGDLGNIFNGNSINGKIKETVYANVEEGYNYISTKDVAFDGKEIEYNTGVKIPYDEKKFKVAHNGAVLICSEGGSAGRKIGLVDKDICFGNKLYAIEPLKGILSEYIFYVYQSPIFFNSFANKMTGIIGGISITNFKEIIIPLCSLSEQKRIVKRIESLMTLCDILEKALEEKVHYGELSAKSVFNAIGNVSTTEELEKTLKFILLNFKDLSVGYNAVKELKNCILQLAIQGKLVAQDVNDESLDVLLGKIKQEKERLIKEKKVKRTNMDYNEVKLYKIPKSWREVSLGTVSNLITDGTHKTPKYLTEGVKFISAKDIKTGVINFNACKYISYDEYEYINNRCQITRGTLLISKSGNIGEIVKVDTYEKFGIFESLACINLSSNVNNDYIKYALSILININREELIKGVGVKHLHLNELRKLIIPLPPLMEQERIVEKVDSLMILCNELEKKIERQNDYSNRLMKSIIKEI